MTDPTGPRLRLFRPLAALREQPSSPGYEIKAQADGGTVDVLLYDEVGGWWGVEASVFVKDLMAIDAEKIELHINSPGGSAYDGMAIYQALRNHKAHITVYVDGLAASAAAFIAMAGDRRVIAPHATMMIHEPFGVCIGPAEDMTAAAQMLDKLADNMAALHARRAGGEVADWREVMRAETWYSAEEAVAAGLMHEVQEDAEKPDPDGKAQARWDLSVFAYAGREQAPPPRIPGAVHPNAGPRPDTKPPAAEPVQPTTEEDMVSTLNAEVRQWLGLADDPDDAAIVAAVQSRQSEHETLTAKLTDLETRATAAEKALADKAKASADESAELRKEVDMLGTRMESMAAELKATKDEQAAAEKKSILDTALAEGKFTPAEREQWEADYDDSPQATVRMLARLPKGFAVPVSAVGHTGPAEPTAGADAEWARIEAELWGPNATTGSKGV